MHIQYLPNEILVKIFEFLSVGDLLSANLVCRQWRDSISLVLKEKVTIMATEEIFSAAEVLHRSSVRYKHWVFKNIDLSSKNFYEQLWYPVSDNVKSLSLIDVEISERNLMAILQCCRNLDHLCLAGLSYIFMTGTFLSNTDDLVKLQKSLKNVTCFRLSCSRYLTDLIFSRLSSTVGPLKELCLSGCQISYQNSIFKRFYPDDGRVLASDHVFTFKFIMKFIQKNKSTLKKISLNRTSIDSQSLKELSQLPGLELQTLHLMACDQMTKSGIELLTKSQRTLTELDVSLCSRVTDYAVIAIADNLPGLRKLSLRRCQSVTEVGIENLVRLRKLEDLDISHLEIRKWESIHEALAKLTRPEMRRLNVASLPIQWETVATFPSVMPNLVYLDMSMCTMGVNDRSIQEICKGLVRLEFFSISGCAAVSYVGLTGHPLSPDQIRILPYMTGNQLSLESLGIVDSNPYKVSLGSKAERAIREEARVRHFLARHSYHHHLQEASGFGLRNLKGLKELNLCGCIRVSDFTLCNAFCFTELRSINLSHCPQVDEGGLIEMSVGCPSLEIVQLTDCVRVTDRVLLIISHKLKRLKSLDLQRCIRLTDDSLDSLSCCFSLRYLDISGCELMTLEGVDFLKGGIPGLLNFHHRGIRSRNSTPFMGGGKDGLWGRGVPSPPPLLSLFEN